MMHGLNLGSGQRCFHSTPEIEWINVDVVSRPPNVPDVVCNACDLSRHFTDNIFDYVVAWHLLEHFGCGEADPIVKEAYRVLKPGGSFIAAVPDLDALARRWLAGELEDFLYTVNLYGAYQGLESDRHRWGWSRVAFLHYIEKLAPWRSVATHDDISLIGTDLMVDWWMSTVEATK
jgi:SAM-dependent methyltransferase